MIDIEIQISISERSSSWAINYMTSSHLVILTSCHLLSCFVNLSTYHIVSFRILKLVLSQMVWDTIQLSMLFFVNKLPKQRWSKDVCFLITMKWNGKNIMALKLWSLSPHWGHVKVDGVINNTAKENQGNWPK